MKKFIYSFLSILLGVLSFNSYSQCDYTLILNDSWGDGWNGSQEIEVNYGANTDTFTLNSGSSAIFTITVNNSDNIDISLIGGPYNNSSPDWHSEVSIEFQDAGSSTIYSSGTAPANGLLFSTTASCPSCLPPTALNSSSITTNSVILSWTENNGASIWSLEYGPSGFTQGSGTTVSPSSTTYSLGGLSAQTSYDWYISSDCGANGTSTFAMNTFTTSCAIEVAPWTESIQNQSLPNCWTEGGPTAWKYDGTNAYGASGVVDHSGSSGSFFVMDGSDNTSGETSTLTSPSIDISPLSNPLVSFFIFSNNVNDAALNKTIVELYDGTTWHKIDSIQENLGSNWVERTVLLSSYTISGPVQLRFSVTGSSTGSTYYHDILLDDIGISEAPSCPNPSDLMASSITTNSAIISWTENASATEWMLEYDTLGFTQGTGNLTHSSSNPFTLNGLNPITPYQVYVRSICSVGDSSDWFGPYGFETLCDSYTAPYSNNFETDDLDEVPSCWKEYNTGVSSWVEVEDLTGTSAPYSGSQALYLYSSSTTGFNTDTLAAISPQFSDLTAGDKRIVFQANSSDPSTNLIVASTNIPNSNGTFNIIDTINFTTSNTYQQVIIEFTSANGYNGTDEYIVLMHDLDNTYDYIRIDEFEYETIPACAYPINLNTTILSSSSAEIAWTNGGAETSWNIEYGTAGFTQGTGTTFTTSSNPDTLSGLTPFSSYDVYLQANCKRKVVSTWAGPTTFYLGYCNPAPVSVDNSGITNVSFSTVNNSTGTETNNYGDYSAMVGDISQTTTVAVDITYQTGYTYVTEIWIDWNDDLDFDDSGENVYSGTSTSANPTTLNASFIVPANAPLGQHRMRIGGADSGPPTPCYTGTYASYEDYTVNVIAPPACPAPINLTSSNTTSNSVDLSWVESGTATTWQISYGTTGFTAGTGTQQVVNSTPYTLNSLTANTTYEWYVRSICGAGDTSNWSTVSTIITPCTAVSSFPFSENFDGTLSNGVWECWKVINADSDSYTWTQNDTYISPRSGSWTAHGMGSNNDHLITPLLSLPSGVNMEMKVWDIVESSTRANNYSVLVSTSGSDIADFTDTLASYSVTNTSWTERVVDLSAYSGMDIYISLWQSYSNSTSWGFGLDDFTIEEIPSCIAPTSLTAGSLSSSSAILSWTENNSATAWEIEYGPAGFSQGSGSIITISSNPYSLTGLTSETDYDWYVRTDCGGTYSAWSNVNSFTTPCAAYPAPFSEGFATFLPNNCWNEAGDGNLASGPSGIGTGNWTSGGSGVRVNLYSNSKSEWILSPAIDFGSGGYELALDILAYDYSASPGTFSGMGADDSVVVAISSNGGNWTPIYTWSASNLPPSTSSTQSIDLTSYTGSNHVIGIWASEGSTSNSVDYYFEVDNFEIRIPPSCIAPSALAVDSFNATNAFISWIDNAGVSQWEIEYDSTGYTQGSGSTVIASSTTHTLTGLNANESYDIYVRADCGAGNLSSWIGPVTVFTGYCTPSPSSVDNSGITNVSYSSINNSTGTETNNYGDYSAMVGDISQTTTVSVDITYETGYTYVTEIWIDWNNDLDFDDSGENVYSGTSTSANPTTLNASFVVPANAPLGHHRMRIGGADSGPPTPCYTGTYASYEDYTVNVIPPPSCLTPTTINSTNVTATSADLSWTENNSATTWQIEYGPSGFSLGNGNKTIVTSNPFNLSGLNPVTEYDWYVRAICGVGDTSLWSVSATFTTACNVYAYPFFEDFENAGDLPTCWQQSSTNQEDWKFGSGSAAAYGPTSGMGGSGYYAWLDDSSPQSTASSLETPFIDLGAAANPGLEFQMWSESHSSTDSQFLLHIEIDAGSGFSTLKTLDIENNNWELQRISLYNYIGQTIKVRFKGEEVGTGYQKDIAIDNISIDDNFECEDPTNLVEVYKSDTSAVLLWDANPTPGIYYWVQWKEYGTSTWNNKFMSNNIGRHDISGLKPNTSYLWQVRSNCMAGWSNPVWKHFKTLSAPCLVPTNIRTHWKFADQVQVKWDTMPNSIHYRLRYREQGTSVWQTVIQTRNTEHWIVGLTANTTYEYQVKSTCEWGFTSGTVWSAIYSFTTTGTSAPIAPSRIKFDTNHESLDELIQVYPNPNKGEFKVSLNLSLDKTYTLELRDITGRIIQQDLVIGSGQPIIKPMNIQNAKGIYLLHIYSDSETTVKRVVIE